VPVAASPSATWYGVGTPDAIISQLNALPACAPVNASVVALRLATHDSGSGWIATPFLYDSFIHDSTPVYPGAHHGLLTICKTVQGRALGGSWNGQSVMLFARAGSGIFKVTAAGGEPEPVTTLNPSADERTHSFPSWLPDHRHFVYLKAMGPTLSESSQLLWRSLGSGEERLVRRVFSKAFYASTGHLVFRLNGPLVAQPFDPTRGITTGDPMQLAAEVWTELGAAALAMGGVLLEPATARDLSEGVQWCRRGGTCSRDRPANVAEGLVG
jgi:hypothetical protein